MIINGDITYYGHSAEWNYMRQHLLKQLKIPYEIGLGNHDMVNNRMTVKNIYTGDYDDCFDTSMHNLVDQEWSCRGNLIHNSWDWNYVNMEGSFAHHCRHE